MEAVRSLRRLAFRWLRHSGDTILYADCQADMIKVWKAIIDTVGHYARPTLFACNI